MKKAFFKSKVLIFLPTEKFDNSVYSSLNLKGHHWSECGKQNYKTLLVLKHTQTHALISPCDFLLLVRMESRHLFFPVHLYKEKPLALVKSTTDHPGGRYYSTEHFDILFLISLSAFSLCGRQSQNNLQWGHYPCFSAQCHPAPICVSPPGGPSESV